MNIKKRFLKKRVEIFSILFLSFFFLPFLVLAVGDGIVPCKDSSCSICDLVELAQNIINFLVMAAASIATALFVYAGILYIFAGGDKEKISKAHSIFFNVVVGFVIVLAAWLIVDLVMTVLLDQSFSWHSMPGCEG